MKKIEPKKALVEPKRTAEKPVAVLTRNQHDAFKAIEAKIQAASEVLNEAYKQRSHLWGTFFRTYGVTPDSHYIRTSTGEVFATWPKVGDE